MNTDKIYAEAIANQYSKKSASKVVALKKLDRRAKLPAEVFAYTFGVAATLVFGTGLCFAMGVLGGGGVQSMVLGVVIGLVGLVGAGVNYPIYRKLLQKGKDKYAGDIIRLANEIAKESE